MRNKMLAVLRQQGANALINAITNTKQDLKRAQYTNSEIKETIIEWFFGLDGKVDIYINNNF